MHQKFSHDIKSLMMKKRIKHLLAFLNKPTLEKNSRSFVVPVLCYHSVNSKYNLECDPITPLLFEKHLAFLKEHYNVISLRAFVKALLRGQSAPRKSVVITFDDGYRDNFEVAFPLLVKYGLHATMFVPTGFIDGIVDLIGCPGWEPMTWSQIRELDLSPLIEIGAHGHTHSILAALSDRDAAEEVCLSKERLEVELRRKVDLFAYPFGQKQHISQAALETVRNLGFLGACSTLWHTTHNLEDRFLISRVMVNSRDNLEILKAKLEGRYNYINSIQRGRALLRRMITGRGLA